MRLHSLIVAASLAAPLAAQAEITYHLRLQPQTRHFEIRMDLRTTMPKTTFHIPAWSPGYYQLAHYERKISDITVLSDKGASLPVISSEARTWTVEAPVGTAIHFSYKVLGDDQALGFFGSMLDGRTGFINGASAFMYVDGRKTEPDDLDLKVPDGWDVETAMNKDGDGYRADSGYDEFIDNPIQMGTFVRKKFTVEGIPFEVVYVSRNGNAKANLDRETERLRKVSAPAIQMFRGAGFTHYDYIIHLAHGDFAGGLEHRASTCIAIDNTDELNLDDLAGHENFHAWNVKQIRPAVLGPFDYTQPDRTANLWWMEGVTDYYSKIVTYRSGLEDSDWLLNEIREQFQQLQGSRQRTTTTLEDCSRNCWESDGFGVGDLSYYTKGFLVGLILDASIRAQTNGEKSLDDVMRLLFNKYRLPHTGVPEDGILAALDEVVGKPTCDALYHQMVQTTDELPYEVLRNLGIEVMLPGKAFAVQGYEVVDSVVTSTTPEASEGGLKKGDKILSVQEMPWNGVSDAPSTYTVQVSRDGSPLTLTLKHTVQQANKPDLIWDPTAGEFALKLRKAWLERPDSSVKEGNEGAKSDEDGGR